MSTLNTSARVLQKDRAVPFRCLGRGRDKRLEQRIGLVLDARSIRQVQPQGSGSDAVSVRGCDFAIAHLRRYDGDRRVLPFS